MFKGGNTKPPNTTAMPITVGQLIEQLSSADPNSVVCLAVEGIELAPLSQRIAERDGKLLLRLSVESELAEVLSEIDIIR